MADNSLLISKYIQQILEENEEIRLIIGENAHAIFPLLQPDNLNFPFIVHSRTGLTVKYTKDIEIGYVTRLRRIDGRLRTFTFTQYSY